MTPPPEYANYLRFLGFSDIQEPYTIYAGTKVFRFHPISDAIPDAAYSWENITWALEAGLLLRSMKGRKDLAAAVNVMDGLATQGVWLEGFEPKEVWRLRKWALKLFWNRRELLRNRQHLSAKSFIPHRQQLRATFAMRR